MKGKQDTHEVTITTTRREKHTILHKQMREREKTYKLGVAIGNPK